MTAYTDADMPATVSDLSASDIGPYSDSALLSIVTTIPVGEYDYVHPTGFWGSFDDDDGVL